MFNIGSKDWPGISKLIEECGEVLQVCGKLMGSRGAVKHWDGTNLRDKLNEEIGDLQGAIWFVISFCGLDEAAIIKRAQAKRERFERWHVENPEPSTPLPLVDEFAIRALVDHLKAGKCNVPTCPGVDYEDSMLALDRLLGRPR